jgi:transposase-like protein
MKPKIKRWTAARKAEVVQALLKGTKQMVDLCRENDLKQSEVERWEEDFLSGGQHALKSVTTPSDQRDAEIKDLRAKVGELLLEIDARKKLTALTESRKKIS